LSVLLRYTDSDCPFGIFKLFLSFCPFSFGHCVVCSSSIYGFWLPPFGIFKLFLLYIRVSGITFNFYQASSICETGMSYHEIVNDHVAIPMWQVYPYYHDYFLIKLLQVTWLWRVFLKLFVLVDTLISNDIIYGAKSGFIFSTDQSVMRLSNLEWLKTEYTSRAVDQLTGQNT
jgi:hypothetical protein